MRAFFVSALLFFSLDCGANSFTSTDGGADGPAADAPSAEAGIDLRAQGNLVLWLDGSKGVTQNGQRVTLWADQSGNGNDAHGGPAPGPLVVPNGPAGRPALHFEANANGAVVQGCMLVVNDKPTLQLGTGNFVIEIVARWDNDPTQIANTNRGALFSKGGIGNPGATLVANNPIMAMTTGGVAGVVGTTIFGSNGTSYNDNAWRTIGLVRTGAMAQLRIAGQIDGTIGVGTQSASATSALLIGATGDTGTTFRLNGDIAEILVYAGNVPAPPLIEAYLRMKYLL